LLVLPPFMRAGVHQYTQPFTPPLVTAAYTPRATSRPEVMLVPGFLS
jgi:hypothetical protein